MTPKPGVRLDGVCVSAWACMHVCVCVCTHAYMHGCVPASMCACINICMYVVTFLLVSMCCDTTQFPLYTLAAKIGGHTDHNNELRLRLLVAESGNNVQNGLRHLQGTVLMVVCADQQHYHLCHQENIMVIKRISRVFIYSRRWENRALYNNANNRHRHPHMTAREGNSEHKHSFTKIGLP